MTVAEVVPQTSDVLASFRAKTGPRSPTFDSAYPVPFQIERDAGPRRYPLSNRGRERRETSSSLHASFRRRIRIRSPRIRVASAIGSGIPQR